MEAYLYKTKPIEAHKIICICHTQEEAQKLFSLGWAAVAILDKDGWSRMDWIRHMDESLSLELKGKRIVIIPHQNEYGKYCAGRAALALIPLALDIRIVNFRFGPTLIDYFASGEDQKDLAFQLELSITEVTSITSYASLSMYEAFRDMQEAMKNQDDLSDLEELVEELEIQFNHVQNLNVQKKERYQWEDEKTREALYAKQGVQAW